MLKPMLAATARSLDDIWLPCFGTPKVDGIRAITTADGLYSRNLKPIQNRFIQECCRGLPLGLDGELIAGADFNSTQSAVMSKSGEPDFLYLIFDHVDLVEPYYVRQQNLLKMVSQPRCMILPPEYLDSTTALREYEADCVALGYEGIVTRHALGPYQHRRALLSNQYMVKYKRLSDSEAIVLEIKEGKTEGEPRGTMGSLLCIDTRSGKRVNVGGFDNVTRDDVFTNQQAYVGRTLTYQYQDAGLDYAPRFPRFLRWYNGS